eukprot:246894-Pleurochrysis_carterae.AAC.1
MAVRPRRLSGEAARGPPPPYLAFAWRSCSAALQTNKPKPTHRYFKTSCISDNHLNIDDAARGGADLNGTASGDPTDLRFNRPNRASPTGLTLGYQGLPRL